MSTLPRVGAVLERAVWKGRNGDVGALGCVSLDGIKVDCSRVHKAYTPPFGYSAAATASATAISTNASEKVGARPRSA